MPKSHCQLRSKKQPHLVYYGRNALGELRYLVFGKGDMAFDIRQAA